MSIGYPKVVVASENSTIVYFSGRPCRQTSDQIDYTANALRVKLGEDLIDLIPSYHSLLVIYDPLKIGFQKIELDEEKQTVFLPEKGMKIGFGGIGKGYAADQAKKILISRGVKGGIINASGDMNTWGKQPDGSPWTVGIINPMNKEKVFSWLSLEHDAVVTSGNYEKFTLIDGERFSHIVDPRTGIPSKGIISSTIFANKAELADALATATFVMGVDSGMFLINQLPNIEAILIDDNGVIYKSKNIELEKN